MKSFTTGQNISFTWVLSVTIVSLSLVTSYFYSSSTTEVEFEQRQDRLSIDQ